MKIAILGAAGQLGRQLCAVFPGEVVALTRADADLTRPAVLRRMLERIGPRVVVNAAAHTQVDRAEADPTEAFAVNAIAVRDLATMCRDLDFTLIHFSTDYVFGLDLSRNSPYSEADTPGPINVYGQSKLAGEQFVQSICPKHFVVRTCGLYGSSPTNFVATMLRNAAEGNPVRVVDDQVCAPTSVLDLANAMGELLDSQAYGLYHVTNAGSCTWHEFARTIFEVTNKKPSLVPVTSREYAAPARRPRYSVLSNARWISTGFTPMESWQAALECYLGESKN